MNAFLRSLSVFVLAPLAASLTAASLPANSLPGKSLDDARQSYNRADYNAAIGKLGNANDGSSLLLLGQSYVMVANYKQAADTLERALVLNPNNSDTHLWLGRAYGHRAENAFPTTAMRYAVKSREHFEKAVQLNAENWDAFDDLFQFYLQAPGFLGGGPDKAEKLIGTIAKHDPAEAAADRGRIAEQKKDYTTAEAQFRMAVQLAPQQASRKAELTRFLAKRKAAGG